MNLKRVFPFLGWLPLRLETLRADLTAGITVALVAIPQSLAYAQLAGLPAYYGLYAALIPTVVGALFGSSGALSTGPVAMTSLLTAASIAPLAAPASDLFIVYAILLALVSGLFQILFGLLRMGVLLNFLSHPVLMGFINAAAIIISLAQIPTLLGISASQSKHLLTDTWHVIVHIDRVHELSLIFGVIAIAALVVFRKRAPRFPGVLISVAVLTLLSYLVGYESMGGRVVGQVPQGIPVVGMPPLDWHAALVIAPAGFLIAIISFMEAMSSCRIIAIRTRTPWDENQELIGQGLAKVASALSHSFPVSGSFSRSALNLAAGARTGMSSIIAAAIVLLTLLVFTPLLHHLPKPVLAAIIIVAVVNLVDFRSIRNAWLASRDDGIAAAATFVTTLLFAPNIQIGILAGIIISLSLLMYRLMRPRVVALGLLADGSLKDPDELRRAGLHPAIGVLQFDGRLLFVNVAYFEQALLRLARENSQLKYIVVVCYGINGIDASGVERLSDLVERLKTSGIQVLLGGVKQQVLIVMERTGLAETIGKENFFDTRREALEAARERLYAQAAESRQASGNPATDDTSSRA
jgi:SulP family sulfate permease